jgi:hypothetical protein
MPRDARPGTDTQLSVIGDAEMPDSYLDELGPLPHTHWHHHGGNSNPPYLRHTHEHTHRRIQKRRHWRMHQIAAHLHTHRVDK